MSKSAEEASARELRLAYAKADAGDLVGAQRHFAEAILTDVASLKVTSSDMRRVLPCAPSDASAWPAWTCAAAGEVGVGAYSSAIHALTMAMQALERAKLPLLRSENLQARLLTVRGVCHERDGSSRASEACAKRDYAAAVDLDARAMESLALDKLGWLLKLSGKFGLAANAYYRFIKVQSEAGKSGRHKTYAENCYQFVEMMWRAVFFGHADDIAKRTLDGSFREAGVVAEDYTHVVEVVGQKQQMTDVCGRPACVLKPKWLRYWAGVAHAAERARMDECGTGIDHASASYKTKHWVRHLIFHSRTGGECERYWAEWRAKQAKACDDALRNARPGEPVRIEWGSGEGLDLEEMTGCQCMLHGRKVRCWTCGVAQPKAGTFPKCARCGLARYCGAACQKAGWKRHKKQCKAMKKGNFFPLWGTPTQPEAGDPACDFMFAPTYFESGAAASF